MVLSVPADLGMSVGASFTLILASGGGSEGGRCR